MAKESLYTKLLEKRPGVIQDIIAYLKDHSIKDTAYHFAPLLNENPQSFVHKLNDWNGKYRLKDQAAGGLIQQTPQSAQAETKDQELTVEEESFLNEFREGKIGFEQVQREFAYRVLRKVMADPRLLKASDWLKSELVKIQREELAVKTQQMEMNWVKLLGGFMPPDQCPHCGGSLKPKAAVPLQTDELTIIDADITNEESMGNTANIS